MSLDRPPVSGEFKDAAEHNALTGKHGSTPAPFSLRLTAQERASLLQEAGHTPLGAYIRLKLLGEAARPRRAVRQPIHDEKALAQLLGELGRARLANNLNQLAKAANSGSLAVTPETEKALHDACQDVEWMRERLIVALGLSGGTS
jgi:hypothetical protein